MLTLRLEVTDMMEFLRQTEVIQWIDGEYKTITENSVDDEYTYLLS